ncbi:ATP synthase subunit g, mitochondrial-like [Cimex lectularius]|uniref:ATP synthase subunit g n=1 Tax=Cimex lectularius TaxID=79782 RepID=A0A8I6S7R8_CIMLE|nr:ATP synthase subunit g, mitochondrial-like [Cimex lectularius]
MAGSVGELARLGKNLAKVLVEKAKPNLVTFAKYAKVELAPPTPGEMMTATRGFKNLMSSAKSGKWKQLTVKEAWLNTLIATEVCLWFFVGECIGKMNLVGYKVNV